MEPKLPSESRLIWLGIVTMIMGIAGDVITFLQSQTWDFTDWTAAVISSLTIAIGILTIILRFVTKTPIAWSK